METNSELEQQITARLHAILADYKQTPELVELEAEVQSNLMAAVIDKIAQGQDKDAAIDQAFTEFGDIKGLADELAAAQGDQNASGADDADDTIDIDIQDIAQRAHDIAAAAVASAQRATKQADKMQARAQERAEAAKERAAQAQARAAELKERAQERAEAAENRAKAAKERAASEVSGIHVYGDTESISVNGQVIGVDITADEAEDAVASNKGDRRVDDNVPQNVMHAAIDGIGEIATDYRRDDVAIIATDDDQVTVSEYFHRYREDYNGSIETDGDKLIIKSGVRPRGGITFTIGNVHLGFWSRIVIAIPRSFAGKLSLKNGEGNLSVHDLDQPSVLTATNQDGNIELVSLGIRAIAAATADGNMELRESKAEAATVTSKDGNVEVTNVHAGQLKAHTSDGNLTVTNVRSAATMEVSTADGNVTMHNVNGADVSVATSDGNLNLNGITGTELTVITSDGDADLQALSGAGMFKVGDGNLTAQFNDVTGDITVKSGDGDVDLALPQQVSYTFDLHAGDGDVYQDEDGVEFTKRGKHRRRGQKGDTPAFALTAETRDGNLSIH